MVFYCGARINSKGCLHDFLLLGEKTFKRAPAWLLIVGRGEFQKGACMVSDCERGEFQEGA